MEKKGLFDESEEEKENEYAPQTQYPTEPVHEDIDQQIISSEKQEEYQGEPQRNEYQMDNEKEEEVYVPPTKISDEQEEKYIKPIEEENQIDSNSKDNQIVYEEYNPPSDDSKEDKNELIIERNPSVVETNETEEKVTEAELKLKEDLEKAKNQLLNQIKSYQNEDFASAENNQVEIEDPRVQKFSVSDPVKASGHVKYTVTGVDDQGEFKQQRRYRDFNALSQELKNRWPGCYIPAIPEKKLLKNNETQFVDERRVLLERFMKECAKYDYIVFSEEFKLFARGNNENIDKMLSALTKQTPIQLLEKYRFNFKIDDEGDTDEQMSSYTDTIMKFLNYLKKVISVMEMQKKQLKQMTDTREKHDKGLTELTIALMKFENIGISYYSQEDHNKRILTHPNHNDFDTRVQQFKKKTKNSFKEAYLWMKGEYLDALGMLDCLQGREQVMKAQLNTNDKMEGDKKELNKLKGGKTTFKSLLKSKTQKESQQVSLQQCIEIAEQEIKDYKQLINFLTIYHGKVAIPKFKAAKCKIYLKMLNGFCVKEISNAHSTATLFHSLLEIEDNQD